MRKREFWQTLFQLPVIIIPSFTVSSLSVYAFNINSEVNVAKYQIFMLSMRETHTEKTVGDNEGL